MPDTKNYVAYHVHSDLSLLDSCTQYQQYIDEAVKEGMSAISISEHGKPLNWTAKKQYCDAKGIRYLHSVEIYMTERLEPKERDNYHTVLIARNEAGVRELNELVTRSCQEDHFYYVNRISFDEFLGMSDNIISTSACLASPLNKLTSDNPYYEKLCRKYTFFEVQPHNQEEQAAFNRLLYDLSLRYGKKLIAGTDAHSVDPYKSECRDILLEAKNKKYDDDGFDLTWKTYDELVAAFKAQGVLPEDVYLEAIENTNVMADMVEDFELDTTFKYPLLYGSREEDAAMCVKTAHEKLEEKIRTGVIPENEAEEFRRRVDEELEVFEKLQMNGFMLSMGDIVSWCKERGFPIGPSRGSVGGSTVAYVLDITDLDAVKWRTNFYRFANPDRLEAGDVDVDVQESDRPVIFQHIVERFGSDKTARVSAFGTLAEKATIDEIGRALARRWSAAHPNSMTENSWSLRNVAKIKADYEENPDMAKTKYADLFYYFDGLLGTTVSQSIHPAGIVISSVTLDDNYGTFIKDGERCLVLDMDAAHDVNLIKYDLLILKTVQVINDTCKMLGTHYPKMHEVDFDDQNVWDDISKSTLCLFQMESSFAGESLKKFKPTSIDDITLVTACIRPSGASYRDRLLARQRNSNPSEQIDDILKDNYGFLVYQEDILRFLMEVCELSGGEADTVRRGIAKKKMEILESSLPKIVDGYCRHSDKPREIAETEVKDFIQIIEDASAYMFGRNHALGYSLLTYLCGYYRYYYPMEYITAFLNDAANDDDIQNGTSLAKSRGITITSPKFGFSSWDYSFNKEHKVIAQGLGAIKYMGSAAIRELMELYKKTYIHFTDLLFDIANKTSLDARQLDILIKLDFFSDFGNQRELFRILDLFNTFKKGEAKQIKRSVVDGTPLEPIVQKYAVGVTKSGGIAKSYTLLDVLSILREAEQAILAVGMPDLDDVTKVLNYKDIMGFIGYVSGKEEDRRKLFVTDVKPLRRKSDDKLFGYSVFTKSIGSGVEARFTCFCGVYNKDPIQKDEVIYCSGWERDGKYYRLTDYRKVV